MKKHLFKALIAITLIQSTTCTLAETIKEKLINKYVFDVEFYLAKNPDVNTHLKGDKSAATEHWINTGFYEGRQGHITFSLASYVYFNLDLANAFGPFQEMYLTHFLENGIKEGRQGSFFYSGKIYNQINKDVSLAFAGDQVASLNHYLDNGINEGRQSSPYFSIKEYLNKNNDVATAYNKNYKNSLLHYAIYGINEGRPLGNVVPLPTTGGNFYAKTFAGQWRSPQLPGYRFSLEQEIGSTKINVCRSTSSTCWLGIGASGKIDIYQNAIIIGRLSSGEPNIQITLKFLTLNSAKAHIDACNPVSGGFECDVKKGDTFDLIKE